MRALTLPSADVVELHQSIFELPTGRHSEFQYWLIRQAGLGSDAAAIGQRFSTATALLAGGKSEEAADALAVLHYAFEEALAKFSSRHLAFGCLVAKWKGQPWTDTSQEGLSRLLDELSAAGLTEGLVVEEVETVKKELRRN
jgi:hypothetical protein